MEKGKYTVGNNLPNIKYHGTGVFSRIKYAIYCCVLNPFSFLMEMHCRDPPISIIQKNLNLRRWIQWT